MAAVRRKKAKTLDFSKKLVLNQWLLSLLGIDPLKKHWHGSSCIRPLQVLTRTLRDEREGLDEDGLHYFYHRLHDWHMAMSIDIDKLLEYEQNIVEHTAWLNAKRERTIEWKYYQWLALLFTEIYLDHYFTDRERLLGLLNDFVERFNEYWQAEGYVTGIEPYTPEELNKVCMQCATGSGKTLLMHVNFRQFVHYAEVAGKADELARTVLITPNEALSQQHARELENSGITAQRLVMDNNDLFASNEGRLARVDYIEITKLGERDGDKTIATRNLGDRNLLLVDEGHRGLSSSEEKGWYRQRERMTEKGFAFEYSATFKESVNAANDAAIEQAYAKAVLFDYSYRYFYEDGYGKDYRIFNLPTERGEHKFVYLCASLLSFYQQLRLYDEKYVEYLPFNLEKPLWVFVGSSVAKSKTSKGGEKATTSDIVRILQFLAFFLFNPHQSRQTLEQLLDGNGRKTGLVDDSDHDIFHGSFLYLQEQRTLGETTVDLHTDILRRLFNHASGGQLHLQRLKGESGELLLKVGQAEQEFGLINVGEARELARHIEATCPADSDYPIMVEESDFETAQFDAVKDSSSPINLLLGAKKFIEGWDCWRVSSLGLMNVGKSEGSQIIQLFGRGVRLKGYEWSLKRSSALPQVHRPDYIGYIETLNVFGLNADFMEQFQSVLQKEGLPSNDQKQVYEIPMNLTYDFGHKLKVLRPKRKDSAGREYQFNRDGVTPLFGEVPDYLQKNRVVVDWYPKITSIISDEMQQSTAATRHEAWFSREHIAFLDTKWLYFQLEEYKARHNLYSLILSVDQIAHLLEDISWYVLQVPANHMELNDFANVHIWHRIALELLKRYCRKYFEYCAKAFIRPRLQVQELSQADANLPEPNESYQLTVDASEQELIANIESLQAEIAKPGAGARLIELGNLRAHILDNHLYQPLLHVEEGTTIQVSPVALNDSEMTFVTDLSDWLDKNHSVLAEMGMQIYLLRNQSRGKGIGFFEAGNFYPDFILWLVNKDRQVMVFIEPHGISHEGPEHPKVQFHQTIKEVEQRLPDNDIQLESFIVTPTRFAAVKDRGLSLEEWEDQHVLFMYEQHADYISRLFWACQKSG